MYCRIGTSCRDAFAVKATLCNAIPRYNIIYGFKGDGRKDGWYNTHNIKMICAGSEQDGDGS